MRIIKTLIILLLINLSPSEAKEEILKNKITKNLRCLICRGRQFMILILNLLTV